MLYKKYHRNFVRKFKKGTRFKWNKDSDYIQTTITEPFIELTLIGGGKPHITININVKTAENDILNLVYTSGRLAKYCYVI